MLTVGSFFSGVDMFDLGLRAAGMQISYQVEYDEFCQRVLKARGNIFDYPDVYGDIRDCGRGRKHELPRVDVMVGGFPCQPFSISGKRQGENDDRNMWSEFARIIGESLPRWVILENVAAILNPVDGKPAYALTVLADLARMGYSASWGVIRASDAGLPHGRERWFCVAKLGNANSKYAQDVRAIRGQGAQTRRRPGTLKGTGGRTSRPHSKSRMDRDAHGLARWMDRPRYYPIAGQGQVQYPYEPPRVLEAKAPHTSQRLKALGNGGIAQIMYEIGKAIVQQEAEAS